MVRIITIPNDNDPVMNAERGRIAPWAHDNGWLYTGYENGITHLAAIKRVANGAPIEVLDFDCHGNPGIFDHIPIDIALEFGKRLALIPGVDANTSIYLDACNTGLLPKPPTDQVDPIAQIVADGARCTVYGTKGYMDDGTTYAEGNERCHAGKPPEYPCPGAQTASGRDVWIPFQPRAPGEYEVLIRPSITVGVNQLDVVSITFDPMLLAAVPATQSISLTVSFYDEKLRELVGMLEGIIASAPIAFPKRRIAPDMTISYVRKDNVMILDVYANGGLLHDRAARTTWRIEERDRFIENVRRFS